MIVCGNCGQPIPSGLNPCLLCRRDPNIPWFQRGQSTPQAQQCPICKAYVGVFPHGPGSRYSPCPPRS